ncbi:5-hydroxytryptamine receptor 3A-like [Boleophthalmus pectinirostris]|uniref:5-hydroxytryptamine receptor 3A-like n=1 Tax=Boleophthalmus pectinirostris TaxID=150288 RepID=UPI00242A358B|nr:5-hydroxytryptamine receptor 3A-like [Boleophthalmus pectinirostris]
MKTASLEGKEPELEVRKRGKQFFTNTLYSAGEELLSSNGDVLGWWKENFEDLLNPTVTFSEEEVEAGDLEVDSSITLAEVTEVVKVPQWLRGILDVVFPGAQRNRNLSVLEIYTGCYGNYGTDITRSSELGYSNLLSGSTDEASGSTDEASGSTDEASGSTDEEFGWTDEASKQNCSYYSIMKHLQLSQNSDMFSLIRPVWNHTKPTDVLLDIIVYAILDVREIDQTMVSYVWTSMEWKNDFIRWDINDSCQMFKISIPVGKLWTPDITIVEMTERDKSTPSPFISIKFNGDVLYKNDQVIISTCRLHIYKFPFDTQRCNLSYRSVLLDDEELSLRSYNSEMVTQWSLDVMRTQYEWIFKNVTVTKSKVDPFGYNQDIVTYTILMERRSILYIANFILPVLFFLVLDFASFLISDSGGEKLGFKVTVLLAVTVMQLLLNEILPSSSNRIPLIAVFCIGIFSLMLLSLLESILVLYLINRDQRPDQDQSAPYRPLQDVLRLTRGLVPLEFATEKVSLSKAPNTLFHPGEVSEQVLSSLLNHLQQNQTQEEAEGYWTRKSRTIHRVFFIFYLTSALSFLGGIFYVWTSPTATET